VIVNINANFYVVDRYVLRVWHRPHIGESCTHRTRKIPQPHPAAGEFLPPPLGGGMFEINYTKYFWFNEFKMPHHCGTIENRQFEIVN